MENIKDPEPKTPEENNPESKIFAISDKLRGVYLQLEKDIQQGITEKTFDNLGEFLDSIQELKSLNLAGTINSLLSAKATKEEKLEKIDTIFLGSQIIDVIEQSIQNLDELTPGIREKIQEERLNHLVKTSAESKDDDEIIPKAILELFKDETGKIGSGIHLVKTLLDNNLDSSSVEAPTITKEEYNRYFKDSLDQSWKDHNEKRKSQEKNIEDLLNQMKPLILNHFSIKQGMGMCMLHAVPDFKKTYFSGVMSFLSMSDDTSRELSFSGDYDADKNLILKVTFKDDTSGQTFTQELTQ